MRELRRFRDFVTSLLLALCVTLGALCQTTERYPCEADRTHPGWRVYANREFRFCLKYPPTYQEAAAERPDQYPDVGRNLRSLVLKTPPGAAAEDEGAILFVYFPTRFSM